MWYNINCKDKINAWRNWRQALDNMTLNEALADVACEWAKVPTIDHYLVPEELEKWPSPWELINDNCYCDLAIALGMCYSLSLSKHANSDIVLNIYRDYEASSWIHLCLVDNGKYVLNWNHGQVVNTPALQKSSKLIYQYKEIDLAVKLG